MLQHLAKTTLLLISLFAGLALVEPTLASADYTLRSDEILKHWNRRQDLQAYGDDSLGIAAIEELQRQRVKLSLKDLPEISIALLREARVLEQTDRTKDAEILLDYAVALSPSLVEPHYEKLRFFLPWNNFNPVGMFHSIVSIVKLTAEDPVRLLRYIFNTVVMVETVASVLLTLIVILLLLKLFSLVNHDMKHIFPLQLPSYLVYFLILLLFSIVYFSLGFVAVKLLIILLVWRYISSSERSIIIALLFVSLAIPAATKGLSRHMSLVSGPYYDMLTVNSGLNLGDKVKAIHNQLKQKPDDHLALFSLALAQQSVQKNNDAKLVLERAINANPDFEKSLINLGNIYSSQNQPLAAIEQFKKVIDLNPNNFLAHYNLGKAYYSETRLDEGNQALRVAKNINAKRFQEYEEVYQKYNLSGLHLFNTHLNWPDVKKVLSRLPYDQLPRQDFSKALLVLATLLILIPLSGYTRKRSHAIRCEKCGLITCARCDKKVLTTQLCLQCFNIYERRLTIDPELKIRKERAIRYYQNRRNFIARLVTLILPGSGLLYLGDRKTSYAFLAITACFLTALLPLPYVQTEFYLPILPKMSQLVILMVVFLIFYMTNFVKILRA